MEDDRDKVLGGLETGDLQASVPPETAASGPAETVADGPQKTAADERPEAGGGPEGVSGGRPAFLVFLFSLVPGAGHMYMGFMNRGLQLMLLFFGTLYLSSSAGQIMGDLWGIVVAPITWFYSFFDSLRLAGCLNRGEAVPDRGILAGNGAFGPAVWGWLLVGVGMLLLLGNLVHLHPQVAWWVRRTVPAVVLMALGAFILFREGRRGGRKGS